MTLAGRRVLLAVERSGPRHAAFVDLARNLAGAGAAVTLAEVDLAGRSNPPEAGEPFSRLAVHLPPFALLCGLGRAGETEPLRAAYALDHAVRSHEFELAIAPLRGGLAQGLLMRRATGEPGAPARIVLWGDTPSRWAALAEDETSDGLAPLVTDALERASLRLADAVIGPDERAADRLRSLGEALPPLLDDDLPSPVLASSGPGRGPAREAVREIVYVGRLSRRDGVATFMDALEGLARDGIIEDRLVTFLGPLSDAPDAFGATLLGVRSTGWPFRFTVIDARADAAVVAYLAEPGRLAVLPSGDSSQGRLLRAILAARRPVLPPSAGRNARTLAAAIAAALERGATHDGPERGPAPPALLPARLAAVAPRQPPVPARVPASVSVCLLHRFRPALLRAALASVRARPPLEVEAVVVDNAGDPAFSSNDPRLRVLRLDKPLPPGAAYNRGADACGGEALVFLDDDNVLANGGLDRFAAALGTGWFDVVVTSLDVVDGEAATGPSSGRAMFLGDAGMAGLFFNGFGDTALAIAREAFMRIGGFPEPGHLAPAWDWVLLAKARAAGLRIGVLREPAVRYARRVGGETSNWLKLDREGARRAVLEAYGEALDGPLLARFAQGTQRRT